MFTKLETIYQYKSKLDGEWYECQDWEVPKYKKYGYETRTWMKEVPSTVTGFLLGDVF